MIKYKTFKIKDELEINLFLLAHSFAILDNGLHYHADGTLSVLYREGTKKEISKELLVNSIQQGIQELRLKLAAAETQERFARAQAIKGNHNSEQEVVKYANEKDRIKQQIYY